MARAMFKWASETNQIPGIKIKVENEDTRYDMAETILAYKRMMAKNPTLIMTIYSQDADITKPVCTRDMIPNFAYFGSTFAVDPPGWVFTDALLWDVWMIGVMNWIADTWDMGKMGRPARMATLGWDNTMGTCVIKPAELYAAKLPTVDYVAAEVSPPRTMDFSTYMTRLKTAQPDYVVCPMIAAPVGSAIKTAVELGMSPSQFIVGCSTTFQWEAVLRAVGKEGAAGILTADCYYMYSDKTPEMELVQKLYKADYGELPPTSMGILIGANPAMMVIEALKRAVAEVGVEDLDSAALYRAAMTIKNWERGTSLPTTFGTDRREGSRSIRMYACKDDGHFYRLSDKMYEGSPHPKELFAEAEGK